MSKLPVSVGHLSTNEIHAEIRNWMKLIKQDSTILDEATYRRLEALVDEIGYRNSRLLSTDKDQQRKLNWWRTFAVAIVAFGFCVIAILISLMLTKGA